MPPTPFLKVLGRRELQNGSKMVQDEPRGAQEGPKAPPYRLIKSHLSLWGKNLKKNGDLGKLFGTMLAFAANTHQI